jgi:pteridine reductase
MTPTPVALITGAAKRIGAAIAELFHQQGYTVIIHYRHSSDDAAQLCQRLNSQRAGSALMLQADLNDQAAVQQLASEALARCGGVDILINNASSFYATALPTASEQDWNDLINSNVKAAFFLSQALAGSLQARGGCIINIIDIHADSGLRGFPIYSIAKAGLKMLTRSLARELAPAVRVNGVSPGAILWPEHLNGSAGSTTASEQQKILDQIPLGHLGEAADIAQTVWFLTRASYMTGQVIRVDGGRSLR